YFEYENLMSKLSRSLHQAFESLNASSRTSDLVPEQDQRTVPSWLPLVYTINHPAPADNNASLASRSFPIVLWADKNRCQSRIARTLPADQKPECRPYWEKGDPSMPLPFDLTEIVSELRGLLLETRP
ncbi:hypothetical protein JEQ12_004974, partial [Ovis aries]